MKKLLIISLIIISAMLLTGCGSKNEPKSKEENNTENNTSNEEIVVNGVDVDNCKNCVFAYYDGEDNGKFIGENGDILTEYTNDYTTLKDKKGNQREVFLGHMLDNHGKILRGFVCGLKDNKVFCLEAYDGVTNRYKENETILRKYFDVSKCRMRDRSSYTTDSVCDSNINGLYVYIDDPIASLNVRIGDSTGGNYCSAANESKMYCINYR